jgi:ATP-binding cassette subfamily B multidrug efflux pump
MEPSRQLTAYLRPQAARAVGGFLCVVGYIAGSLYTPVLLRRLIDGLGQGTLDQAGLLRLLGALGGLGVFSFFVAIGMRRLLLGLANHVEYAIRRDVFDHLTRMDQAFYQRERTGDLMTKMSSDLSAVRELVGQGLLQGSRMVVGFPLAFGVMFATNTRMALIVTALLPFVSILFFFLMRLVRKYYERAQDQFSLISNFAQESFAGIRTLKGFGIEERQRGRFRALNEEYIRRNMTLTRIEEPVWPFMMFLYWVGAVLLLLTGGRQVLDNQLTIGTYVQFQQYLIFLQWPMLALGWTVNILQRGLASWRRIRTILDARPEVADPPGAPDPGSTRGDIEFRGVRLRRGGQLLLDGIDLRIPSGQCLALTGPTGSGKTLLMSLLVRLLDPDEGLVTIGGRDVRAWPLPSLRRRIALAPQEPFLFSDTLANNLAFGLEAREDALTAHEERVAWAARLAHLEQDVAGFPERYQTVLGERGVTLSGGQRQRTAIGRAVARQPDVLLLDDVFSAVDTQTEAKILEQLLPELRGRTSVLISHRVSTLRHADRIIVLEGGRITQDGSHAQLIAQPGYYRDLDEVQRLAARLEAPLTPER